MGLISKSCRLVLIITIPIVIMIVVMIACSHPIYKFRNKRAHNTNMSVVGRVDILTDMFQDLNRFCNERDIRCIPSFGTLLGLVRGQAVIEYDDDVDVFMEKADFKKFVDCRHEFNVIHTGLYRLVKIFMPGCTKYVVKHVESGLSADVIAIGTHVRSGTCRHRVFWRQLDPLHRPYPSDWMFPLQSPVTIGSFECVHMPAQPEHLLCHWYGETWETPKQTK